MIIDWKIWVSRRAYTIWEAEGRPEGRHEEHWYRAESEITHEEEAKKSPRRSREAAPPSARPATAATKPRQPTRRTQKAPAATSTGRAKRPGSAAAGRTRAEKQS